MNNFESKLLLSNKVNITALLNDLDPYFHPCLIAFAGKVSSPVLEERAMELTSGPKVSKSFVACIGLYSLSTIEPTYTLHAYSPSKISVMQGFGVEPIVQKGPVTCQHCPCLHHTRLMRKVN